MMKLEQKKINLNFNLFPRKVLEALKSSKTRMESYKAYRIQRLHSHSISSAQICTSCGSPVVAVLEVPCVYPIPGQKLLGLDYAVIKPTLYGY